MKRTALIKLLSAVMTLALMFGVCAPTAHALVSGEPSVTGASAEKPEFNYVSLGASNVNGYGMHGYLEEEVYEHPLLKGNSNIYGYKQDTPGSYPVLIKDALSSKYNVNLAQLAMSSMRAEEVRFLLDDSYKGDAYTNWRFCDIEGYERESQNWFYLAGKLEWEAQGNTTAPTYEQAVEALKVAYKDAIKNADLITVDIGVNNFGVYASNQIVSNMYENDLNKIDPEIAAYYAEGKAYVMDLLAEKASDYIAALSEESLNHIVDSLAYTLVGFCLSFDAVMEQIYTLNPDATVVVVSIQNLMYGFKASLPGVDVELPLGELFGSLVDAANVYTASVSPYAGEYLYTDVRENGHVEFFMDEMLQYNGDPTTLSQDVKDCFDVYDDTLYIKTRVQQILAKELYKGGLLDISKVPAGYDIVGELEDFALAYQFDLLTIPALNNCTLEQFFAAGAAGQLPNVAKPYYEGYVSVLNTAYDVCAEIMQAGLAIDTLDGSAFGQKFGPAEDLIFGDIFYVLETAVGAVMANPGFEFSLPEASMLLYGSTDFFTAVAEKHGISPEFVKTVATMGIRTGIGSSFFGHPNGNGQKELADSILYTLENGTTGFDFTVEKIIETAIVLKNLVVEYHDEAYAYGYAELKEAGVIAELQNALTEAQAELAALKAELVEMEADEQYAKLISLLVTEIGLTDATIAQLLVILEHETLTAETWQELDLLCDLLVEHCYSIVDLAAELGVIGLAHTEALIEATIEETERLIAALKAEVEAKIAELKEQLETAVGEAKAKIEAEIARLEAELEAKIAELEAALEAKIAEIKAEYEALKSDIIELKNAAEALINNVGGFVEELYNVANEYLDGALDEAFAAFVDAAVAAAKRYAPEVADFIYNWLYNNPEKVIGFFAEYGDEMVDFLKANAKEITAIIAYIVYNYGEDIAEYVLENADVILCALVNWIDVHGENAWALIKVYLDALGVSFELDLDLTTPEGLIDAFNKVTGLLAKLVAMIADGVYDYLEALDVIDEIEAALAELKAYVAGVVEEKIDAIKEAVDAKIAEIKAAIEAEIAAIKAEIEAKIAALKAELENAVGEAKEAIKAEIARLEALLEAKVAELEAKLEALVKAEIENLEDLATALKDLAIEGLYDLGELVYEIVTDYVDAAVKGSFTPTEDSYYVSVNGGSAYYAELLAEKLAEKLDVDSINLGNTTWDDLDYDMLSKADLITIGYDENELSAFAVEQMLAYIANYADVTLRNSTSDYIANVFGALQAWVEKNELNYNLDDAKGEALAGVNGVIDELLAYELIAGKEIADMNWTELVGAENVKYVDDARASLKAELLGAGVIETYTYTIDVVDYIYANADELGIPAAVLTIVPQATAYKILGENAYYTVEVPVADAIVFAAESYLYNYVSFNVAYGKLIVDLYEINPDATIILLGAYNAYDVELTLGDVSLNLGEAYSYIAGVSSVQPYVYALLSSNVAYVDISDAETVYESYVAAGVIDNSLLNFAMLYLADSSITDASVAGNEYIYEQILGMLTVGCAHEYDNECDETCNKCGAVRVVAGHVYDGDCDETCNACGAVREGAGHKFDGCRDGICNVCGATRATTDHVYDNCLDKNCNKCGLERTDAVVDHYYDNCYDTKCDLCGETREAEEHAYDNCDDVTCYKCNYVREAEEHVYDDCGDASCNKCGVERVVTDHVYDSACDADCNKCGETRTVGEHVYSGCTDTDCNKCGASRTAGAHVADDCEDAICNVCGQNIAAIGHSYGEWKVTAEATRNEAGEKSRVCTKCNHTDTKVIGALGGISGGAIAAIVIGAVVVAGAAGFAIYWFIIQKKTFAQFLALFNKNAAEVVVSADAPAADASNEAPANEETPAE